MNFDQGEFNFDAQGSTDGYLKWREELDRKKRAFEVRWGVILGRSVCVTLLNHAKPISGILEWVNDPKNMKLKSPQFRIKGISFNLSEIESIVQQESP